GEARRGVVGVAEAEVEDVFAAGAQRGLALVDGTEDVGREIVDAREVAVGGGRGGLYAGGGVAPGTGAGGRGRGGGGAARGAGAGAGGAVFVVGGSADGSAVPAPVCDIDIVRVIDIVIENGIGRVGGGDGGAAVEAEVGAVDEGGAAIGAAHEGILYFGECA